MRGLLWIAAVYVLTSLRLGFSAESKIIERTITINPTDVQYQVGASNPELWLTLSGVFYIPAIDAAEFSLRSITADFTAVTGASIWRTGRTDEIMTGELGGNFSLGRNWGLSSGSDTGGWSSVYSSTAITAWRDTAVPIDQRYSLGEFLVGSPIEEGGFIPLNFSVTSRAWGQLANVPPPYYPSKLVFIADVSLKVTYTLEQLSADAPLPFSNFPEVASYVETGFQTESEMIPQDVVNELSPYVIPEPQTTAMLALTLIGFLVLAGRKCIGGNQESA